MTEVKHVKWSIAGHEGVVSVRLNKDMLEVKGISGATLNLKHLPTILWKVLGEEWVAEADKLNRERPNRATFQTVEMMSGSDVLVLEERDAEHYDYPIVAAMQISKHGLLHKGLRPIWLGDVPVLFQGAFAEGFQLYVDYLQLEVFDPTEERMTLKFSAGESLVNMYAKAAGYEDDPEGGTDHPGLGDLFQDILERSSTSVAAYTATRRTI